MHPTEDVFEKIVSDETIADRAYKSLKDYLESGRLVPGQKLPSENEMARQMNISRVTLRTALQKLELLGYVDRKRGVGTFVVASKAQRIDAGIERLVSISDVIRQRGHTPGAKKVQITAEKADEQIASELQIHVGDPVTVIKRIRTMDGQPLMYDTNIFPASVIQQNVTETEIGSSIFNYILKQKKLNVTHAVARLVPGMADERMAKMLDVEVGTLLICLVQVHYINENDAPIWQSTLSFPENKFSWYIVRTR